MCGAVVCARCSCGVMWCVQVPRQPRTAQNARDRHRVCCEPQQRGGRTYSQPNVEQAQVPDWGFLRREHPAGACSRWAVDGGASARNTCTLAPNQLTVASSFHSMLTCSRFTVVPQARTTMPLSNHAESLLQWMLAPQHPTCRQRQPCTTACELLVKQHLSRQQQSFHLIFQLHERPTV